MLVSMATLNHRGAEAHLCFTGFFANVESITCKPSDTLPGPLLTGEVLWASILSLLFRGHLVPALRLACSYIMCCLRLGLRVSCSPAKFEVQRRARPGVRPTPDFSPAIEDLVAWVPKATVHFLLWAARHTDLQNAMFGREWMTDSSDVNHSNPFPYLEVKLADGKLLSFPAMSVTPRFSVS